MTSKKTLIFISIIILLSLSIRLFTVIRCENIPSYSDMARYNKAAITGKISEYSVPPGYPFFIRIIYAIFGRNNYKAVYTIQAIISTFSVFLIYWITGKAFNIKAAFIASTISAFYPGFILYNCTYLTETLGVFFILLIFAIYFSSINSKIRPLLYTGTILISYPIKPVFLFFIPGILLSVKRKLIFLISLIIIFFPITIYLLASGRLSNRPARAFYKSYNPKSKGAITAPIEKTNLKSSNLPSKVYLREGWNFIKNNKQKTFDIIYSKANLLNSMGWDKFVLKPVVGKNKTLMNLLEYIYLPVMLLGFIGLFRYSNSENRIFIFTTMSYLFIIILFFIFKIRYRLLIEPTLVIFSAVTIERLFSKIRFKKPNIKSIISSLFKHSRNESFNHHISEDGVLGLYRKYWLALLVIIIVSISIRSYLIFSQDISFFSTGKTGYYTTVSRKSSTVNSNSILYPILTKAVHYISHNPGNKDMLLFQSLIHTLTILFLFGAVTKISNKNAGFISAIICALYPKFILYNLSLSTLTLSALVSSTIIFLAINKINEKNKKY